jgi:glucan 1,3-beta-glucosidase
MTTKSSSALINFFPVTEPFISPALFEEYINNSNIAVVDEWTLSLAMGKDLATKMEAHYKTFIVRPSILNLLTI